MKVFVISWNEGKEGESVLKSVKNIYLFLKLIDSNENKINKKILMVLFKIYFIKKITFIFLSMICAYLNKY